MVYCRFDYNKGKVPQGYNACKFGNKCEKNKGAVPF